MKYAQLNRMGIAVAIVFLSAPMAVMGEPSVNTGIHPNEITPCNLWPDLAVNRPSVPRRQTKIRGMSSAGAVIGTNAQQIHRNFAKNIEANFDRGSTERIINKLSDKELAALARDYQAVAGTTNTPLLRTFATRLSDVGLVRIARTFNRNGVKAAVAINSSPAVKASFDAKVNLAGPMLLPPGGGGSSRLAAAPTTDMTIEEIYMEFRSAEVGNLSVASALSETAQFAATKMTWSASLGYAVGSGISYLIQTYDPSLDDAIGGTISGVFDNASHASSEIEQGHYESAFDDMFGFPVSDSLNPYGDWGVSEPMQDYYGAGGGCGW